MKSTLDDDKLKDKITDEDRESLSSKLTEVQEWFDNNQEETKETYDAKLKELQDLTNPIMTKLYSQEAPSGMPDMSGMPGMPDMSNMGQATPDTDTSSTSEPTIEEVD